MISEERLEVIVRDGLARGLNAAQIARRTGVPQERVQRMLHRVSGRDPAAAARVTAQKRRQQMRRDYGSAEAAALRLRDPAFRSSRRRRG